MFTPGASQENLWESLQAFTAPSGFFLWVFQPCVSILEMHAGGADGCIDLKILVGVKAGILSTMKGQQQVDSQTNSL